MTQIAAPEAERGLRMALWGVALVGAVIAIFFGILGGAGKLVAAVIGASVAVLNLWSVGLVVRGYLGKLNPNVPWGLLAVLKLLGLFVGIYGLVQSGWVEPLPLLSGYGALPLGIVAAQLGPNPAPFRRPLNHEN